MSVRSIIRAQLDELACGMPAPFDVQAHTGADIEGTVRSSEEHVADLAAVDGRSVVFPLYVTTGYRAENERVIAEARRYPERLVAFARLGPKVDSAAAASEGLGAGARGFKLHPRGEAFRSARQRGSGHREFGMAASSRAELRGAEVVAVDDQSPRFDLPEAAA